MTPPLGGQHSQPGPAEFARCGQAAAQQLPRSRPSHVEQLLGGELHPSRAVEAAAAAGGAAALPAAPGRLLPTVCIVVPPLGGV